VRAELLVWWLRSGQLPPIITSGPDGSEGVLGEPGTRIAYGDEKIDTNRHLGMRLILDYPLNDSLSLRSSFFVVERNSRNFDVKSDGSLLVARPYLDANTGSPASVVLAGTTPQGIRTGGFDGLSKIELFGEELGLTAPLFIGEQNHLRFLAGAYLLQMRERLDFKGVSHLPSEASLFGDTDRVRVHDRFYGVQLGLESEHKLGALFLELRGKVAFGPTERVLKLRGEHVEHTPLEREESPFGFLVLPSNRGTYRDDEWSIVCQFGVNGGYCLADWCRVYLGYTLIRWSNTIRAGDQLDTTLDFDQRAGEPGERPRVRLQPDYFWTMGINCGVEIRW
jgi:hypothetical protein